MKKQTENQKKTTLAPLRVCKTCEFYKDTVNLAEGFCTHTGLFC